MPYKLCPSCQQTSYSACTSGIWFCPSCGKELTLSKAQPNAPQFPIPVQERQQALGKLHIFPPK